MAAPSKVQDFGEVARWFEEGRTYKWMVATYLEKYDIQTTISMWSGIRHRHGFDRRITRDDVLIPWAVEEHHRYAHPISMLRAEARRRAGHPLGHATESLLEGWLNGMRVDRTVLAYLPETEKGWHYMPRRDGIDLDIIREPDQRTTKRLRRT